MEWVGGGFSSVAQGALLLMVDTCTTHENEAARRDIRRPHSDQRNINRRQAILMMMMITLASRNSGGTRWTLNEGIRCETLPLLATTS